MHDHTAAAGTLTLMGSGEMTPGMAKVHRAIMARGEQPPRPAFVDTPAGFELNHAAISSKAQDYFQEQFSLALEVASFPNAALSTPEDMTRAMRTLRQATYIFAGPGSPTYAVRNWRETPVFETIAAKLAAGAHVTFASAAALAMGRHTVPVYEIYKVGEDPRWIEGLDLLGRFGFELAVVPHWNNNSGGSHDTSRAFIGQPRFEQLRAMLPPGAVVLGIDEYTACTIDFAARECSVSGAGNVTVLRNDRDAQIVATGERFSIDAFAHPAAHSLNESIAHDHIGEAFAAALSGADPAAALSYLHGLMDHLARVPHDAAAQKHTLLLIREMTAALAVWLEGRQVSDAAATAAPAESVAPYVDQLVALRGQLRAAKQWALADVVRNSLTERGIVIEDSAAGSTWRRAA